MQEKALFGIQCRFYSKLIVSSSQTRIKMSEKSKTFTFSEFLQCNVTISSDGKICSRIYVYIKIALLE